MQSEELLKFRLSAMEDMRDGVRALIKGDLKTGWNLYRRRNFVHWFDRRLPIPYWDGQDIKGKRLLLMYEQGLGEQIFFAAVVPELVALGIQVVLEVDERLVSIMKRSFPGVEVIPFEFPFNDACYTVDYQCFIGTAYGFLRPSFDHFPQHRGYLKADQTLLPLLDTGFIGLSWFSNAQFYSKAKNIPFELWEPLVNNGKIPVISVQYGNYREPITRVLNDVTQDLDTCATLLTKCRSVISVSNTIAHLAAALGVDTHILVPNAIGRHFYWYPEKDTVPNYPSAKAYLQMPAKDWKPLVKHITKKVLDI